MPDVIDNIEVGKYIKELLKERNMTQSDLAKELNISKSAVSQNLNGKSTFDIQNLMRISEIFEVSIDTLLNMKSDEDRDIISEYERLVRKGYEEIAESVAERLNLATPDLYGKVFVEYVIEYDKRDIFEYLIKHNINLFDKNLSNSQETQLRIIKYMIEQSMNGFITFLYEYVIQFGSFQIPSESLEKDIIEALNKYPDKDIVSNLFTVKVTQNITWLKYFKRTKKYLIFSGKDWSKVIGKYHANQLLDNLLETKDIIGYIDTLMRYFIQYGYFDGIKILLKYIAVDDIERIKRKHLLAQELILLVSESKRIDLFKQMTQKGIYNDLTKLCIELIKEEKDELYQFLLKNHYTSINFRLLGMFIANNCGLDLLKQISIHFDDDDKDYIFSTTPTKLIDMNLLLLQLGAKMNAKYLNKDTSSKINLILTELIIKGDE